MTHLRKRVIRNIGLAAAAILTVGIASLVGGAVTAPAIPTWHAGLVKPAFNPPNWVFAPVWTVLYALMAYAFWRVLRLPANTTGRGVAVIAFVAQIILNASWSVAFFGMRSPFAGLVVIVGLLVSITWTILLFRRVDGISALLLVPYVAWVAFAAILNFEIWRLN
jgi:tryptophan-rich sensory protein